MFVLSRIKKQQEEVTLERYHGPLITNGVELGHIKIVPWLNLFLSGIVFWGDPKYFRNIFLILLFLAIFTSIYSFFNFIIIKCRFLSYMLLIAGCLNLLICLDYIVFEMFISDETGLFSSQFFVKGDILMLVIISIIMTFFVYPYFYRRDRRTNGAYREKESKFNSGDNKLFSSNFLIIFGLVVLVPPFLTGHLENVLGFLFGILFSLTIPALVVDSFYAVLYAKQHPEEVDEL